MPLITATPFDLGPPPETILLMHFDGNFNDEQGHTITMASLEGESVATINNTTTLFGSSGSGQFNGNNQVHITNANAGDFIFGTNDFTIEFWMRPTSTSFGLYARAMIDFRPFMTNGSYFAIVWGSGSGPGPVGIGTNGTLVLQGTTTPPQNTWTHVAFVRKNGIAKLYVGGTEEDSTTLNTNYGVGIIRFGSSAFEGDGNVEYIGLLEDVRFSTGAVYTSNFTPTGPLT